ncbi:flavin reductase, partial [Mesorhizobium sp. M1A.F.Ca.IN.020.06.1.1]|uniref:flavin reductase family protein n=1 Tax=Mesorhizobium sp. M1A.F.Ca.IN.020.06.1.1 TaxID=2496765 RepID=UPI000FD3D39F
MLSQDLKTERFRQSMRRVASTVCVISCRHDGHRYGITVTSVTPLSFAPISILACVNRNSSISVPLKQEGRYCIKVLSASQADISHSFSGGRPTETRFDIGEWAGKEDVPY